MGSYTSDLYSARVGATAKLNDIIHTIPLTLEQQKMLQDVLLWLDPDYNVCGSYFTVSFYYGIMQQVHIGLGCCPEADRYLAIDLIKFFYAFIQVDHFLITEVYQTPLKNQLTVLFGCYFIPVMETNFYKIFWLFNEGAEEHIRFDRIKSTDPIKVHDVYLRVIEHSPKRQQCLESLQRRFASPKSIRYHCAPHSNWRDAKFQSDDRQYFEKLAQLWQSKKNIEVYGATLEMMQLFLVLPIYDYREGIEGFDGEDEPTVGFVNALTCDYFRSLKEMYHL